MAVNCVAGWAYTLEPGEKIGWQARVLILDEDYEPSKLWTQPCSTRWGARKLAKRTARRMNKAADRGELKI